MVEGVQYFFHIKSIYFHTIHTKILQKFYDHHEKSEKKDKTNLKSISSKHFYFIYFYFFCKELIVNLKSDKYVKMWTNKESKIQFFQSLIKVAKN